MTIEIRGPKRFRRYEGYRVIDTERSRRVAEETGQDIVNLTDRGDL